MAKGFHKKLLVLNGKVVGQIEYAPEEVSGYPIKGKNIIVMNCIWVLKRAKGHNFGKTLLDNMVESERDAKGFATVALENHLSPWLKKEQMEKLGFKPIDSFEVVNKLKHKGRSFKMHLMWLPAIEKAQPPTWNKRRLLEGVHFCLAHLLYHPQRIEMKEIYEAKHA